MHIEPISDHLKRRLREVGPGKFEAIALHTGVALSFIRKFVYGARDNPRVQTIQPLLDFFASLDSGAVSLESIPTPKKQAHQAPQGRKAAA